MTDAGRIVNWIASYPKSGNTWVRFMLLNLIHGPQRTTEHLNTLLPDIHKCVGQIHISAKSPVLIKTHFLLAPTMPLFGNTAGFLYIVRHPMDVMESNLNYMFTVHGVGRDPEIRDEFRRHYVEEYITQGGDPNWIRFGRGSWIEHVECWMRNAPGFPNLLLRYEDLLAAPAAQMHRANDFLGLLKSFSEIETAVSHSTFERMKQIEEEELENRKPGFFMSENCARSIALGNRFMNRGKAGEGGKELTRQQRERFLEKFGPTMEQAGYRT